MRLKAVIETPAEPGEDPEMENLELPPQDMWAKLQNGSAPAETPAAAAPAAPAAAPAKVEVAALQFTAARAIDIELDHPFVWMGETVEQITVQRLTVGQVNAMFERAGAVTMDIYAVMCGLPASVLRGLDDDDGRRVFEAAAGFLPRSLRTEDG